MKTELLCPLCREALTSKERTLVCSRGHSYDLSSEGYVNLAVGKSGSGDSREMCRARRDFLAAGYYLPFAETIASAVSLYAPLPGQICDAGCGEGYYLRVLRDRLPDSRFVGFDLAKDSIRFAAKAERSQENRIEYAVAGIFDMPLPDEICSAVLSVFAPIPQEESRRILISGGILLVAHPGKRHLSGFKEKLYESPYDNVEKELSFPGFERVAELRSQYSVFVKQEDMKALFLMTPYCWKTSREDAERFFAENGFETELDFMITVFRKK